MKRRKFPSLLLALSLLICLCTAFSVSAGAAGTTRTEMLTLSDAASDANAAEGWAWDADTATLTLNSVAIETNDDIGIFIQSTSGNSLHAAIVLKGENTIRSKGAHAEKGTSYGIFVDGSCTITGDADSSLDVRAADSGSNSGFSIGILVRGDLTFSSEGQITAISAHAVNSAAVLSYGKLVFASGSVSMSGESNACQADHEISVADDLTVTGATDYMAVNGTSSAAVKLFADGIMSYVVDGVEAKTITVSAKQQPAGKAMPFTDVNADDWFYSSVRGAWENQLIDGATSTLFKPDDTLTVAQAIKLAAALHQLHAAGSVTLTNGTPWYRTYVDYAVANGILEKAYSDYTAEQLNAPASRSEFVHIFFGALSDYAPLNTVADGKIPDVKMTDKNAMEIYAFYRAGILTGSDSSGTFNAGSTIKRSEAAAILNRMFDSSVRKTITLK